MAAHADVARMDGLLDGLVGLGCGMGWNGMGWNVSLSAALGFAIFLRSSWYGVSLAHLMAFQGIAMHTNRQLDEWIIMMTMMIWASDDHDALVKLGK